MCIYLTKKAKLPIERITMKDIARIETAIKEKARLIRCTNWLISKNYVSFWRIPPPISKSRNYWKSSNHTSSNRGAWCMFHPPPKRDSRAPLLYQRANKNFFNYFNISFNLERTSFIAHEQTQVFLT